MILGTAVFPKGADGTIARLVGLAFGQPAVAPHGFSYGPVLAITDWLHIVALTVILTMLRSLELLPIRSKKISGAKHFGMDNHEGSVSRRAACQSVNLFRSL